MYCTIVKIAISVSRLIYVLYQFSGTVVVVCNAKMKLMIGPTLQVKCWERVYNIICIELV